MPEDYRTRFYSEYVNTHYAPAGLIDLKTYSHSKPFFLMNYEKLLPIDKSASILDVGCGAGQFLNFLKNEHYVNIYGIDLSASMLDIARKVTKIDSLWRGDLKSFLSYNPNIKYNCIVANDVVEHLRKEELLEFLDLCYANLKTKEEARIILKLPNVSSWFGARERYVDFTHEQAFTPESIAQLLRVVGFSSIDIKPVRGAYLGGAKAKVRGIFNNLFLENITRLIYTTIYGRGNKQPILSPSMIAVGYL